MGGGHADSSLLQLGPVTDSYKPTVQKIVVQLISIVRPIHIVVQQKVTC